MPKISLTIHATVDADDLANFMRDHTDMADLADSFEVRLSEVFSAGPEVLTTVKVQSIDAADLTP
jgi:hypothetical protein